MKIQLPKVFSQNDPQWKDKILGSKGTIGLFGCLITDAAMVACYYDKDETPLTLNKKLLDNGGYQNGNIFIWGVFAKIFNLKYSNQVQTPDPLTKAQMDQIREAIDKKYPVFLQIDTIPSTSTFDEHWILAIDYDGDDFIIQDPWDGGTKRITSWGIIPQNLIYAYCWYEGSPVKQEQTPLDACLEQHAQLVGKLNGIEAFQKSISQLLIQGEGADWQRIYDEISKLINEEDKERQQANMGDRLWDAIVKETGLEVVKYSPEGEKTLLEGLKGLKQVVPDGSRIISNEEYEKLNSRRTLDRYTVKELLGEVIKRWLK